MRKLFFTLLFFIQIILVSGQNTSIGQWKEYLSYRKPFSVTAANGRIYCATKGGFFWYSILENSLHNLSKLNGLSDIEAIKVKYNRYNKKSIIIYKNTNLDIIETDGSITNIPDIKNKSLFGNKTINNVHMSGQYAYLACGFGIVVLDMEKREIKDSYNIDPAGSSINVRDVVSDDQYLYASTDNGIYKALKSSNLSINTSWAKMSGLPGGVYNVMAVVNGKLFANLSKIDPNTNQSNDEIYVYTNGAWLPTVLKQFNCRAMKESNGKLLVTTEKAVYLYDDVTTTSAVYNNYNGNIYINCWEAEIDDDGYLWIADQSVGLIKTKGFGAKSEVVFPAGPASSNVYAMAVGDNNLWVVPGGLTQANSNTFTNDGISIKTDEQWSLLNGVLPMGTGTVWLDTIYDMVNVVVDPVNPKRAYIASFGCGLLELYDKKMVNVYNLSNSALQPVLGSSVWTYGLAFDSDNNLWIANSNTNNYFAVKRTNGTWKSFNFSNLTTRLYVSHIIVDKSDQKWGVVPFGGGLIVFKGGPNDTPSSANTKQLSVAVGNGHLPSAGVYSIAEDKDGEIWVGTDKGVCVFYNPEAVFSGQNFDAQTIKLEQDGNIQLLLETETVQAIAIDDGNRKWLGTAGSGVYLMSADGTKQIHHFDSKNSPLFSNNVKSIAIDRKTGEVFFGTDKGIISYRGDAVEGNEDFTDIYAYPNPVKDNYTGPIVIKGLVENTILKITDISGTFVCELNSIGGQAVWDAKNFKGEKVSTGVYMVFCTNQDGSKKIATKIMVIN